MTAVLLRLDGDRAAAWLAPGGPGPARLGRALDDSRADAVLIGAERVAGPAEQAVLTAPGLDPSVVATLLAHHTRRVGLVVTAAPQRDHPFNLARRVASLDHVSDGRAGWLVGDRDLRAPGGPPVWTDHAPGTATTADAVAVVRELWRSWPADAVVADHRRGVFTESHRIAHVDHHGAFDVTGPLPLPEGPQGEPVVLWWWTGGADTGPADAVADALLVPGPGAVLAAGPRFVQVSGPGACPPAGVDGVVVRLDDLPSAGLADRLRDPRDAPAAPSATLRRRLGLPDRAPTPPGAARPFAPMPAAADPLGRAPLRDVSGSGAAR